MTESTILLLAQKDVWKNLGNRFGEENAAITGSDIVSIVAACLAASLLIWGLAKLAKWQEEAAKKPNPQRLFRDLSRLHKLTQHQQTLLQQLAEANKLPQPAITFVRPDLFEAALRVDLPDTAATQLETLRDQLFGVEEEIEAKPDSSNFAKADNASALQEEASVETPS